jgi:hypothetical protein
LLQESEAELAGDAHFNEVTGRKSEKYDKSSSVPKKMRVKHKLSKCL